MLKVIDPKEMPIYENYTAKQSQIMIAFHADTKAEALSIHNLFHNNHKITSTFKGVHGRVVAAKAPENDREPLLVIEAHYSSASEGWNCWFDEPRYIRQHIAGLENPRDEILGGEYRNISREESGITLDDAAIKQLTLNIIADAALIEPAELQKAGYVLPAVSGAAPPLQESPTAKPAAPVRPPKVRLRPREQGWEIFNR